VARVLRFPAPRTVAALRALLAPRRVLQKRDCNAGIWIPARQNHCLRVRLAEAKPMAPTAKKRKRAV
ncbi:MAG: hypothetical protein ACJ8I3_23850, partial [Paraburkholderia graminis]